MIENIKDYLVNPEQYIDINIEGIITGGGCEDDDNDDEQE